MAWFGADDQSGETRAHIVQRLEGLPGGQLVLVRPASDHSSMGEWVYNAADIDHSKVIWARDMGAAENEELLRYYKGRTVWLVQPDTNPVSVTPYR